MTFGFRVSIVSTLSLAVAIDLEVVVDAGTVDVIKYNRLATRTVVSHESLLIANVAIARRITVEDLRTASPASIQPLIYECRSYRMSTQSC